MNLRAGESGDCPVLGFSGAACEDTNNDGTDDTPVGCRTGFKYTVPAGKRYEVTDIHHTGGFVTELWTNTRGAVLTINGSTFMTLNSPFVFQPGETICPTGSYGGNDRILLTGTLNSTSSGVVNMPMTSQVGLAMLTLVLGVFLGRRLRVSWV